MRNAVKETVVLEISAAVLMVMRACVERVAHDIRSMTNVKILQFMITLHLLSEVE